MVGGAGGIALAGLMTIDSHFQIVNIGEPEELFDEQVDFILASEERHAVAAATRTLRARRCLLRVETVDLGGARRGECPVLS